MASELEDHENDYGQSESTSQEPNEESGTSSSGFASRSEFCIHAP